MSPELELAMAAAREAGALLRENFEADLDVNEMRALIRLEAFPDRFLYVSRDVDGKILGLLDEAAETAQLYTQLERERGRLVFEFGLLYLGFAVILILAATWLGLWLLNALPARLGGLPGRHNVWVRAIWMYRSAKSPATTRSPC